MPGYVSLCAEPPRPGGAAEPSRTQQTPESGDARHNALMGILTVGHGTLTAEAFADLVGQAGVAEVVDVRSFPGSRRNPQFGRAEMERWLPDCGIGYAWQRALGGRRPPVPESPHVTLRHPSFRAYADYMQTESFLAGVRELVARGEGRAVMCSESLWWRCHRRLLADHLVLVEGVDVEHLLPDGRVTAHHPTEGVRLDGVALIYDQ